jgi:hypothetical protein
MIGGRLFWRVGWVLGHRGYRTGSLGAAPRPLPSLVDADPPVAGDRSAVDPATPPGGGREASDDDPALNETVPRGLTVPRGAVDPTV